MFQVIFNKIIIGLAALWTIIFPTQIIEKQPTIIDQPVTIEQSEQYAIEKPIGGIDLEPLEQKITILDKQYTATEYDVLKTDVIAKMANRKTIKLTMDDYQKWIEITKNECSSYRLTNVDQDNLVDRINAYIQNGCK